MTANPQDRTPRNAETREANTRVQEWAPPSILPDPPQEAGYVFRWVRKSTLGEGDPSNVSMRRREGWEPVKAADYAALLMIDTENKEGLMESGGLILCKCSRELVDQREAYYKRMTLGQIASVDQNTDYMNEQADPRMPVFRDRSTTTSVGIRGFGKGR